MPALTALLVTVSLAAGADPVGQEAAPNVLLTSHTDCAAPEACAPGCNPCAKKDCNPCTKDCNPCATTCDPCNPCGQCSACCDPCCWCLNGCKWSPVCKYSTGMMYPHFAYYPETHGYYYFRPYNWIHIDQHRLTIPGDDFKNPYSLKVFDQLKAELGPGVNSDQFIPPLVSTSMPKLEALLAN